MNTISLFIGSGFSAPANFPTAAVLNCELQKPVYFEVSDFKISPYSNPAFINDFTILLKLYPSNKQFDYEEYYDFIQYLLDSQALIEPPDILWLQIRNQYKSENNWQVIRDILKHYQLHVAHLLIKDLNESLLEPYSKFTSSIKKWIAEGYEINIFTLNHDLLLEYLFRSSDIDFSDGFALSNPGYYYKKAGIKQNIKMFNNVFNKPVKILKLHGSINYFSSFDRSNYQMFQTNNSDMLDSKNDNIYTAIGEMKPVTEPQFITGKNSKRWYPVNISSYYTALFEKFQTLLQQSDSLVFIGYGFKDNYIQEDYLEQFFNLHKKVVVCGKDFSHEFLKFKEYLCIAKYLEELTEDDFALMVPG